MAFGGVGQAELIQLVMRLGLESGPAARLCHVNARTMRRWMAGAADVHPTALALLRLAADVPAALAWLQEHRGGGLTD